MSEFPFKTPVGVSGLMFFFKILLSPLTVTGGDIITPQATFITITQGNAKDNKN